MTQYRSKAIVEAYQWFKNGDHPEDGVGTFETDWIKYSELYPELFNEGPEGFRSLIDFPETPQEAQYERLEGAVVRFFRRPELEFSGETVHMECYRAYRDHGWIDDNRDGVPVDGLTVCPGAWIVKDIHGGYLVVNQREFETEYEVVVEESTVRHPPEILDSTIEQAKDVKSSKINFINGG